MDLYRELAAAVLGTPAGEVTPEQRRQAKQGFWDTIRGVADLPGNEALRAVLEDHGPRFARLDWQSRWNEAVAVASLLQDGPDVMAAGFFGTLNFRLDRPEDVAAVASQARRFADMVEQAGRDYAAPGIGG
jgi:hypothetical protein